MNGPDRKTVRGVVRRPSTDSGERAELLSLLRRQVDRDEPIAFVVEIPPADVIAIAVVVTGVDGAGIRRRGVAGVHPAEPFMLLVRAVVDDPSGDHFVIFRDLVTVFVDLDALFARPVDEP